MVSVPFVFLLYLVNQKLNTRHRWLGHVVRNFITDMVSVQISLRWMLINQALHKGLETGQLEMAKESGKGVISYEPKLRKSCTIDCWTSISFTFLLLE